MRSEVDWKRVVIAFLSVFISCAVSYFGRPLVHENYEAMSVLVTVFSILAGFLVAVISIAAEPATSRPGSWRIVEVARKNASDRLVRHKWLFIIYLITLGIIFCIFLFKNKYPCVSYKLESWFLFFGTLSFICSMGLPFALVRVQEDKIDAEIDRRRAAGKDSP